jgi:hypothetical protein
VVDYGADALKEAMVERFCDPVMLQCVVCGEPMFRALLFQESSELTPCELTTAI